MMTRIAAAFVFVFAIVSSVAAQNIDDTTIVYHSPKKATIMSACLPGLGQAYNRKYWKMPIIYAGIGAATYSTIWNFGKYKTYRDAYKARVDDDPNTTDPFDRYTASNLLDIRNYYRRNMELSIIIVVAVYALNIVDAAVDAHLYDFNISSDLSMSVQPAIINDRTCFNSSAAGLSIKFNF